MRRVLAEVTVPSTGVTHGELRRTGPVALPDDFLFGVATAGFQVEGGYNGPGEPANNWARWEAGGRIEPSGNACDFWLRPEEALDRAAAWGANAFRLSVEWARLEPDEGDYRRRPRSTATCEILDACHERGMEPIVTLHHFTHPAWLGEEFWLDADSPDRFAAHVGRMVPALADRCRKWITINEPNIVALMGWVEGAYPPGRSRAFAEAFTVLDHLLAAHVLAHRAIHRVQPDARGHRQHQFVVDLRARPTAAPTCSLRRSAGVGRDDLDAWIDERRALHDERCPARGTGGASCSAGCSPPRRPTGTLGGVAGGRPAPAPPATVGAPSGPRRSSTTVTTRVPSTPPDSTGTTRSPATPSGCPATRRRAAAVGAVPGHLGRACRPRRP